MCLSLIGVQLFATLWTVACLAPLSMHQGCQVPFRPPIPNVGLLQRRCSGKGLHLAMAGEPRGFSRVTAGFSSYDGEFRTVACQAPLSMGFSSQEYWSGLLCPPPEDLRDPGFKPETLMSPALADEFFTTSTLA